MQYLKQDSRSGDITFDKEKANSAELQAKLDSIAKEHGDTYIEGIQPVFDPLKARRDDDFEDSPIRPQHPQQQQPPTHQRLRAVDIQRVREHAKAQTGGL
jgi:hypothetical protein